MLEEEEQCGSGKRACVHCSDEVVPHLPTVSIGSRVPIIKALDAYTFRPHSPVAFSIMTLIAFVSGF